MGDFAFRSAIIYFVNDMPPIFVAGNYGFSSNAHGPGTVR